MWMEKIKKKLIKSFDIHQTSSQVNKKIKVINPRFRITLSADQNLLQQSRR
jgi:hypothetical protein